MAKYHEEKALRQVVVAGSVNTSCPKCEGRNVLLRTPFWGCWDCGHQWQALDSEVVAAVDEAKAIEREMHRKATIEVKKLPA